VKYYEVCPSCGGNPEMDEDGNYYTCFACCDTGAVAVEETYEETISRELQESYGEYANENYGTLTHRFVCHHDVVELRDCRNNMEAFRIVNEQLNPSKYYGLGNWVLSENPDLWEFYWVDHDFCGEQNDY
jgi:hypothetical protein